MRVGLAAVLVTVVVTGVKVAGRRRAPAPTITVAEPIDSGVSIQAREVARLQDHLSILQAQVVQLERSAAVPPSIETAVDGRDDAPPRAVGRDPDILARDRQVRQAYIAGIESTFQGESSDPAWAPATVSALQAAMAAEGIGLVARHLECRSRTCKIEMVDDGSSDLHRVLPMLGLKVGDRLPYLDTNRIETEEGAATLVLYMSNRNPAATLAKASK